MVGQAEYHPALVDIAPLIRAGADLSVTYGPQKVTPLLMAAYHGHLNVVKFLVKCGSSFKEKSVFGRNALLCAAWGGHLEVVAWLFHNGCDASERDLCGHTPLLCAAMSGSRSTCAWLRDQGANMAERNNAGLTPLHCASYIGNVDLITWMLSTGSSISEKSISNDTPLLCACRSGQLNAVKLLLRRGATFQDRTNIGENGLMLAALGKAPPNDNRFPDLIGTQSVQSVVCGRRIVGLVCCPDTHSHTHATYTHAHSVDPAAGSCAGGGPRSVRVHGDAHGASEWEPQCASCASAVWRTRDCAQPLWRNTCRR